MRKLKISDLSFDETISDIEVRGGFFYSSNFNNFRDFLFERLHIYAPTLKNYLSEEKQESVAQESRENNGDYIYHRRFSTLDNNTQITVEVKMTSNSNSIRGHMTSYF
ncbi:MAG: hypothetical protein F6K22_25740 [Okeania sp. SIO2F4]|uniref:hypothetical protein n=1 Tax=Okeania sp. SIO2F4 TaxID=2607790 RepID=UPI001428E4F1|nr:hypothetical protein [Okeania sp. SIO2F4]NES05908.1 hypothetical protein [Okeania sp. SIO2F4]